MVNDGAESAVFKQLFQRWTVKGQTVGMGTTSSTGKIGEQVTLDIHSMHSKTQMMSISLSESSKAMTSFSGIFQAV